MLVTLYPPRVDGMVIAPLADDEMIARDQIYNPVPADASPLLTPYSHVVPLIVSVLTSISANAPNDTIAAAKIAARITSDSFIFYLLYFRTLILHGHPPQMRERRMARLTITERFREGRASARPFPYSGRDELLLVRSHIPGGTSFCSSVPMSHRFVSRTSGNSSLPFRGSAPGPHKASGRWRAGCTRRCQRSTSFRFHD